MSPNLARKGFPAIVALGLAAAVPAGAIAAVKEYQIRRMLYLNTTCGVRSLDVSEKDGKDRFFAVCENVAHYPDGIEVLCPASEDERDCTLVTKKREFQHLHHLKP